jgi:hypothetical protein
MPTALTRKQAFISLLLLFLLSIMLRLPNLNRPLSKHHEFNTAVILNNITSWRQAGGGYVFHYTPLMSFQHAGDKHFTKASYIDSKGNQTYLSYGPGLFVIPYWFYQLFHLPVEPVYLQILNLLFNLATILMLIYLFEKLVPVKTDNRYLFILVACMLFMFSPGILWYFGNGFINIDIMMPFVIGALMLLLPMLQSPEKINAGRLILLSLLTIILIYLDWFVFFICIVSGIISLFKIKNNNKYILLFAVLSLAAIAGIVLVFFQFASYTGWANVATYWKLRFHDRSVEKRNSTYLIMAAYVLLHLVTSYLPVMLLTATTFIILRLKKIKYYFSKQELFFLRLYAASVLLYNLVFFNWSSEHEFSTIPFGIIPAYIGARLLSLFNKRFIWKAITFFLVFAVIQYYFINRPGDISLNGTRYDIYKNFGLSLKEIPYDYKIFMHSVPSPMIEYYSGRNFTIVNSYEDAKKYMSTNAVPKAVWIEQDNFQLKKIVTIK